MTAYEFPNAVAVTGVIFAALAIATSFFRGIRDKNPRSIRKWRLVKLWSAAGGMIGIGLLFLNLHELAREALRGLGSKEAYEELLESKIKIAVQMGIICSDYEREKGQQRLNACHDLQDLVRHLDFKRISYGFESSLQPGTLERIRALDSVSSLEYRRALERAEKALSKLDEIGRYSLVSVEGKFIFSYAAFFLVILAVGGSIGEAAYQYRQAIESERKTTQANPIS